MASAEFNNQSPILITGSGGLTISKHLGAPFVQEVVAVANAEGVALSEADIDGWLSIIDHFPADGEPSMRQDSKQHRKSEVELFAGTIRRLAKKHGIPVPVNDWLYDQVQQMEAAY